MYSGNPGCIATFYDFETLKNRIKLDESSFVI